MIPKHILSFLKDLSKNNNKEWFDANRKRYETAKKDFEDFVDALLHLLAAFEPVFKDQKAKDCVFRIYRDVRFSKDKTPYKTQFSAYFTKDGKKSNSAGYYLHIEPGKSFVAGGVWMPEGSVLKAIRQEVDYNFKDFKKILDKASFKKLFIKGLEGEKLKTLPLGYSADNPAIEYLKMKSFIVSAAQKDEVVLSENFGKELKKILSEMKPMVDFLNGAVD